MLQRFILENLGMSYITECKAPDLSDLGATLHSRLVTGLLFHGRKQPSAESASRLLTGYLVVTDKTVREYCAARACLIAYSKSANQTSLFIEGLGRFETCLSSSKRAFRLVDRMAAHSESLSVDRTLRKLLKSWERTVTPFRDAIEHIDGEIAAENVLVSGMAHLLMINHDGDTLEIADHKIALVDLAKVVRHLHQAGCNLIAALPVPESSV